MSSLVVLWARESCVGKRGTLPVHRDELQRSLAAKVNGKTMDWSQAQKIEEERKRRGKTVVFTNGGLESLHAGHMKLLEEARRTR